MNNWSCEVFSGNLEEEFYFESSHTLDNTPADISSLPYYADKFRNIRVDKIHGLAPHKPILLLTIFEFFAKDKIKKNRIYLTSQLNQAFLKNWSYLGSPSHNPDISRPFFHMKSGKFWHFIPNPGYEKVLSSKIKLKTLAEVKRVIKYAYLDEDLFDFLRDIKYRNGLLAVLVSRWFPGRLDEIQDILDTDDFRNPPISIEKIEAQLKSGKWL